MQNRIVPSLCAALVLTAAPHAFAQTAASAAPPVQITPGGVAVPGIGYANAQAIIGASAAYRVAASQLPVTYKAQLDQVNIRRNQITAQLKPLYDKFEADQKAAKPDRAALEALAGQIQGLEQAAQRELQQIAEPYSIAQSFVIEQITEKLAAATQAAMTKRKITFVVDMQNVLKADSVYNLNQDILTELNVLIPTAQYVPPAGWLPRQQREAAAQQAAQQAAQSAAPAAVPAPAARKPEGR